MNENGTDKETQILVDETIEEEEKEFIVHS